VKNNKDINLPSVKYKKWIILVSVAIPVAVAILFGIRIPNVEPLSFLPPIYASINALTAVILIWAYIAIKQKKIIIHERLMSISIALSVVFLLMYVAYHMTSDPTPFGGKGIIKGIYFFILISHILLSIGIIPMVLVTYVRAISKLFEDHKKIARITFPIWLYIAITGVIVYLMISPYYVN
jgi:putative membrane protein|tara:strand:+ start:4200 stop:4742 length:543 start_codon:yes stop_codon:yes gene_type:complete